MTSIRFHRTVSVAAILVLVLGTNAPASPADEREYLGKKLNYWIQVIQDRDERMISLAFDAIRSLGPDGQAAVPDLISLVVAPFSPIRIGTDSQKVIASKLYEIEIRAAAIDTLAAMGEPASSAIVPLVRWALTPKVIAENIHNDDAEELFVELVMMDTQQRMRIAGAISEFGADASPAIAVLLSSQDAEKRKFGVAILGPDVLPIAAQLLRSRHCDDQNLGLLILQDMNLVVPEAHLNALQNLVWCDAN
jgi:hypothetical protein